MIEIVFEDFSKIDRIFDILVRARTEASLIMR